MKFVVRHLSLVAVAGIVASCTPTGNILFCDTSYDCPDGWVCGPEYFCIAVGTYPDSAGYSDQGYTTDGTSLPDGSDTTVADVDAASPDGEEDIPDDDMAAPVDDATLPVDDEDTTIDDAAVVDEDVPMADDALLADEDIVPIDDQLLIDEDPVIATATVFTSIPTIPRYWLP